MSSHWKMTFDVSTLDHLGVKLYKQYEPIIAELISNAWDADSTEVDIYLYDDTEKKIIISDNGSGMTSEEVQNNFLKIGRNRRIAEGKNISNIYKRPVLGKKGIGKLSMFGLANRIKIETIKNNSLNAFEMSYTAIKEATNGNYEPKEIKYNQATELGSGTKIELLEIKRADSFKFPAEELATKLARRFSIFDDSNFKVSIYHNDNFIIQVENKLKYERIEKQFSWKLPDDFENKIEENIFKYLTENNINGELATSSKPLGKQLQGVTFISRGKLAEENVFFIDRATDYFHDYLYGEINVDFIDEKDGEDNISTDRKSILWDEEKPAILKENMIKISNYIQKEWRKLRKEKKEENIQKVIKFNIEDWKLELNDYEKPLAEGLVNAILENEKIDDETSIKYMNHIKDLFSFESFKNYSNKLLKEGLLKDENVLKLLNDWEYIEAKELAKVAEGRVKTINDFEKYINGNYSETKYIQPFFEKFPWVLDPKINSFERELTLSKAIKINILDKEAKNDENMNPLKRMDFFVNQIGNKYIIYELKTPNTKITEDMYNNVAHYLAFSKEYLSNKDADIIVCLVTNNHDLDPLTKIKMESMIESNKIIFTKYNDLLAIARSYNQELINKYEELNQKRKELI